MHSGARQYPSDATNAYGVLRSPALPFRVVTGDCQTRSFLLPRDKRKGAIFDCVLVRNRLRCVHQLSGAIDQDINLFPSRGDTSLTRKGN